MIMGGWSGIKVLDGEAKHIFDKAFEGWLGATYVPLLYEYQIVSGINYRFICNGKMVVPDAELFSAIVTINTKPDGTCSTPKITALNDIEAL